MRRPREATGDPKRSSGCERTGCAARGLGGTFSGFLLGVWCSLVGGCPQSVSAGWGSTPVFGVRHARGYWCLGVLTGYGKLFLTDREGSRSEGVEMNDYRSRAEAQRAERVRIWGDVPFSRREQIVPAPTARVSVNGKPFDIHFDNFGRLSVLGFVAAEVSA